MIDCPVNGAPATAFLWQVSWRGPQAASGSAEHDRAGQPEVQKHAYDRARANGIHGLRSAERHEGHQNRIGTAVQYEAGEVDHQESGPLPVDRASPMPTECPNPVEQPGD